MPEQDPQDSDDQRYSGSEDEHHSVPESVHRLEDNEESENDDDNTSMTGSEHGGLTPAQLQARVEQLEKENQAQANQLAASNGRKSTPLKKEMQERIKSKVRMELWRTIKFVSSNNQQMQMTRMLCTLLGDENMTGNGPEAEHARQEWVTLHADYCLQQLNNTRSYVIGRLREAAFAYMDQEAAGSDDGVPTLLSYASLKKAIYRNFDPDTDEGAFDMRTFQWYVHKLLPRAAGNPKHWGVTKYCFKTISVSHFPDSPTKLHVPPNTEAFCLIVWEGYSQLWKEQWIKKRQDPKANIKPPRKKGGQEPTNEEKKLLAKCTTLDAGQKQFGGWKIEWVRKFVQYKKEIKEIRKTGKSQDIELKAMLAIRAAEEIAESDLEAYLAAKKKRKAEETVAPPEIDDLFEDEE